MKWMQNAEPFKQMVDIFGQFIVTIYMQRMTDSLARLNGPSGWVD